MLAESVAGELIRSEIEIRSGRGETFADAVARQREARSRLFALAARNDALLGATGTHPWSPWQEQQIIDTDHYRRVAGPAPVRRVAEQHLQPARARGRPRRGARGAGLRPAARGDARAARDLRELAVPRRAPLGPPLRAHADLHEELPALRDPGRVRELAGLRGLHRLPDADALDRTSSRRCGGACGRTTPTGTVEMRICDAQASADDSTTLAALITSCVAQAALDHDEGAPFEDPPARADRGELLAGDPLRAGRQADRPRASRGVPGGGGARPPARLDDAGADGARASRSRFPRRTAPSARSARLAEGATIEDIYAAEVALTQRTYAAEEVAT